MAAKKHFIFVLFVVMALALVVSVNSVLAHGAGGYVYCDVNRNGVIDGLDTPLVNVIVTVNGIDVTFAKSAATDSNGHFYMSLLASGGTYLETLNESTLPADFAYIIPVIGSYSFIDQSSNSWLISSSTCITPACGNGIVEGSEECDDGNNVDGDGCSANCTIEPYCGDGFLDIGEQCDDGNNTDGDGCSAICTIEPYCGDGVLDAGEQCDDGNNTSGDGCSATCTLEVGGEGCTPGYWKQKQHFGSWTAPYTPDTMFSSIFENAFPGKTLLDVLKLRGNTSMEALGRHTVAALLNAAAADVNYDLSVNQVIMLFNNIYPGTKDEYNVLKDEFSKFNEQGCPLGRSTCETSGNRK